MGVYKRCRCRTAAQRADCRCRRSDFRWVGRPCVGGHRGKARTFDTKGEAQHYVAEVEAAAAPAGYPDPYADRPRLFCDWVEKWQTTRSVRKPATRRADDSRLDNHLLPVFGKTPLGGITALTVEQWVADLIDLDYAPKTVRHLHGLLSSILRKAAREGLMPRGNPCEGTPLPELVEREPVFLTPMEVTALLGAHDEYWRPFPMTMVNTGLRWAEAVGLRPRYVNLRRGELTVAWTYTSTFGWQTPKTQGSRRTINVPEPVLAVLEPLMFGRDPDEPLFRMPSGVPVHHGYRDRVWRRAVADAGLAAKAPRPHDLRHTFASLAIEAGAPQKALMEMLGHTDTKMTNRYSHIYPARHKLIATQIGVLLAGVPDHVPDGLV